MKKIEIRKYTHENYFTLIGFVGFVDINNKITYKTTNNLIAVKYEKKHLPLKYK